jgi:hypothetical protein
MTTGKMTNSGVIDNVLRLVLRLLSRYSRLLSTRYLLFHSFLGITLIWTSLYDGISRRRLEAM